MSLGNDSGGSNSYTQREIIMKPIGGLGELRNRLLLLFRFFETLTDLLVTRPLADQDWQLQRHRRVTLRKRGDILDELRQC